MKHSLRYAILLPFLAILAACGGGGGGGGSTSGGGFSVTPSAVTFSAIQYGAAPAAQTLHLSVTNSQATYVGAAWSGAAPTWLATPVLEGAGSAWTLTLQVSNTSLPAGTYTATLKAGIAKSDQSILASQDISITYKVTTVLGVDSGSLSFAYINGAPAPSDQTVHISGAGLSWQATASQTWLKLGATSGVAPSTLAVGVDPAGLSVGTHTGTITLAHPGATDTAKITVQFTVTAAALQAGSGSLAFSGIYGGPIASQPLTLTLNNGAPVSWTAVAADSWLLLDKTSGTTPDTLQVGVSPTQGLVDGGSYASTITLACNFGGTAITQVIPVTLRLTKPSLSTSPQALSFSGINGTPMAFQALTFALDNGISANWTATTADSWLLLNRTSGSTPDTLEVTVNPANGALASGSHSSTITLACSYGGKTITQVIPVGLTLTKPTLKVDASSLILGGTSGRDFSTQTLQVGLDTGTAAYPWTAVASDPWIALAATSGTASSTAAPLAVNPNSAGLAAGTYTGSITIAATVNGDHLTTTIPTTLNLDAHRLLASDNGVAFASMPTLASTTRTLQVRDNQGLATAWTATADQAWLTVTAAGTAPGDLVLTANPAGLAANQIYYATVTLASSDTTVIGPEQVQVGFWIGDSAPTATSLDPTPYVDLVTDPIRPYIYLATGGSTIDVYNIYTSTLVTTLHGVGAQTRHMAVATDGSRLFASDDTNFKIVPVDLATDTVGASWPTGSAFGTHLAYARTNGKALLLAGNDAIFDAVTGSTLRPPATWATNSFLVTASLQGNRMVFASTVSALDYSVLEGGHVVLGVDTSGATGDDIALNADGTRLYTATGWPYNFPVYDATAAGLPLVQTLPGNAYPSNVEVAKDGRIFCMASQGTPLDTWIYAADGTLLNSMKVAGFGILSQGTMKVSGDGLRMIFLVDDLYQARTLQMVTVAP
ncbi:MAG TPA: hypothetical protein VJ486_14055 [Geothrix sp.]|nr:hypothetical protein [Geothrix sp.]